jgi:hypothetical protein
MPEPPSDQDQGLFAHIRRPQPRSGWHRFLDFVEHPLFWGPTGIVGGIVGLLFAIPVLLICDGCLLLALHRSNAIADKSRKVQWSCYITLFVVAGTIFILVGTLVKQNARTFAQELETQISASVVVALRTTKPEVAPAPGPSSVASGHVPEASGTHGGAGPSPPAAGIQHARIQIVDVQVTNLPTGEPAFNVFYANRGDAPSKGFLRSYAVRVTKEDLDPPTLLKIQTWNDRRASAKALRDMVSDYHEMYPNDPPNFFTVAGHLGEESRLISQNFGDVRTGSQIRIYIFTSIIYRDSLLPPNVYGVTETCFYYWMQQNVRHDCGNRYIEKRLNDLVERTGEVVP